jgi:hypothetical protein
MALPLGIDANGRIFITNVALSAGFDLVQPLRRQQQQAVRVKPPLLVSWQVVTRQASPLHQPTNSTMVNKSIEQSTAACNLMRATVC